MRETSAYLILINQYKITTKLNFMLTFKNKFQKTLKSNKKESMQAIFDV